MDQLSDTLAKKVNLTSAEDATGKVQSKSSRAGQGQPRLTLIGRVVISREISRASLKANTIKLLNLVKGMEFQHVD